MPSEVRNKTLPEKVNWLSACRKLPVSASKLIWVPLVKSMCPFRSSNFVGAFREPKSVLAVSNSNNSPLRFAPLVMVLVMLPEMLVENGNGVSDVSKVLLLTLTKKTSEVSKAHAPMSEVSFANLTRLEYGSISFPVGVWVALELNLLFSSSEIFSPPSIFLFQFLVGISTIWLTEPLRVCRRGSSFDCVLGQMTLQ